MVVIFLGGMLGGLGRYFLSRLLPPLWGTWAANTLACACLGISTHYPSWHLVLGVGIAGALSTWSTLAAELGGLIKEKEVVKVVAYLSITVFSGATVLALISSP